jgi:hypothetical protein
MFASDLYYKVNADGPLAKINSRFGVPTAVTVCCVVVVFWVVLFSLAQRRATKLEHNIETRRANTRALYGETCDMVRFLYGLNGTPMPQKESSGAKGATKTNDEYRDFKLALHFSKTDFIKAFPKPSESVFNVLKEGERSELYRRTKAVIKAFDRCNTAADGARVPLPLADVLVYGGGMAFMLVLSRFLYTRLDVSGTMAKLAAVRSQLPGARMDVAHAGPAAKLRDMVMCEAGMEDIFGVIKWAMMCAAILVSALFITTVNNGNSDYKKAVGYMAAKARCAA